MLNRTNLTYNLSDNNQILKIQFLTSDHNGDYTCTATNKGGSIEITGTVNITGNNILIVLLVIIYVIM